MVRRRGVLGGVAGLMAAGNAGADEADRNWMVVRLGGQRFRLPRALDDGASDQQGAGGPEQILLRADLPGITPHVMKEELQGESPFLGAMIEILASSLAASRDRQEGVTPELEARIMRQTLGVLFDPTHPDAPILETAGTEGLPSPAPRGPEMKVVTAPKPWQDGYPRVYFNGDRSAPTDVISAGGGECIQFFVHTRAMFQVTYGEHLVDTWQSVKDAITSLFDRAKV